MEKDLFDKPKAALFYLAAKAIFQNENGEILLLHDAPRVKSDGSTHTYWDLPGGRVDGENSLEETLKREVMEETGINNITKIKLFDITHSNWKTPLRDLEVGLVLCVYISKAKIEQITLSNEHQDYGWFPPEKAAELLSIKYPQEFTDKIKSL